MKWMRVISLSMVLLLMGVPPYLVSAQSNTPGNCKAVGGAFIINLIDKTTGLGEVTGDLKGVVRGTILKAEPGANNMQKLALQHVIITDSGAVITTADQATLTPIDSTTFLWQQSQTVTSATGAYNGMTGTLDEIGVVNMATGQGVLRYNGTLCNKSN